MTATAEAQSSPIEKPATPMRFEVIADTDGILKPKTIDEAFRLARAYTMSGILPDRFKTPEATLTAMQFALELGLKPLTALAKIAVVKGTPCIFGDLPLALAYASGKLEWIKEIWLDTDGKVINLGNKNLKAAPHSAYCSVKRYGDREPIETFFTMDEARAADLIKSSPAWQKYPKRMLRYRARSQALKDKFPDALNGIGIAEYDHHTTEEFIDVIQVGPESGSQEVKGIAPEPSLEQELREASEVIDG